MDGITSNEGGNPVTIKIEGDEINGAGNKKKEHNLGRGAKKEEGPEDSQATGECVGDPSLTTLPPPGILTVDLSKESNGSQTPISLSDSTPHTPQVTAWDDQSETLMRDWSRQKNLPDLLKVAHQLPRDALFNLPRNETSPSNRFGKPLIVEMLTKLQPENELSDIVVGYFLSRMAADNDVQVLDSYWYSPGQPDLSKPAAKLNLVSATRTLIPCFHGEHWSSIEVDQNLGTITHYDSLLGRHCCATGG
jgi:hypothetical protein